MRFGICFWCYDEAHGCNFDEFPISKFFMQKIPMKTRKALRKAEIFDFQEVVKNVVTVGTNGKILPLWILQKLKEETLAVVFPYENKKQHISVTVLHD